MLVRVFVFHLTSENLGKIEFQVSLSFALQLHSMSVLWYCSSWKVNQDYHVPLWNFSRNRNIRNFLFPVLAQEFTFLHLSYDCLFFFKPLSFPLVCSAEGWSGVCDGWGSDWGPAPSSAEGVRKQLSLPSPTGNTIKWEATLGGSHLTLREQRGNTINFWSNDKCSRGDRSTLLLCLSHAVHA